jgi:predicted transcriptional regulator
MKRDLELIIDILKFVEENHEPRPRIIAKSDKHEDSYVQYNVGLMWEAGLIEASEMSTFEGTSYLIKGLSWEGHDFLDAARNEVVVNKAKEIAKKQGAELFKLPIEVIKGVLVKAATELFLK